MFPCQGSLRSAPLPRLVVAAFLAGAVAGGTLAVARAQTGEPAATAAVVSDLAALKAKFRRPDTVPFPASNPFTEDKRALGERLFFDKRLSADGSLACVSCHAFAKGLADGRERAVGLPGRPLARHTPTLWNLAWAAHVFWDGRARSLEEQVAGPIENP